MRASELEPKLRTRNQYPRRDDHECEISSFNGPLQQIPLPVGNPAEFRFRRVTQIEYDQSQICITCEEISDLQRRIGVITTHPDQMHEVIGKAGAGIERIGAIDERDPEPICASGGEKLCDKKLSAAARRRTDQFRYRVPGKPPDAFINTGNSRE